MNIAVIGGGIFGALCAMRLADEGCHVTLFERNFQLLMGTSGRANRLHMGYHYPRADETAQQCLRGYYQFEREFEEAKIAGVRNTYFIASEGSLTDPEVYLGFCERLGLAYELIDLTSFTPTMSNVSMGIRTEETVFDADSLRRLVARRLSDRGVTVRYGAEVVSVGSASAGFQVDVAGAGKLAFGAVVNCSYADVNRLTAQLGFSVQPRQYEYVAAPIIEIDEPTMASITIMDGPFVSLLPLSRKGRYLLFHVDHSVIESRTEVFLDLSWRKPETSPSVAVDTGEWFGRHLESSSHFIPRLAAARLVGISQGSRMVLAHCDDTDARPTLVTKHDEGYVTVFSGKVDHCMWAADEVVAQFC